jgi:hypothetical protein
VEPYRETVFTLSQPLKSSSTYLWEFRWLDGKVEQFEGPSLTMTFKRHTEKTGVTVIEIDSSSGMEIARYSTEVMCKYVRREVRQLTDDDLNLFLDKLRVSDCPSTTEVRMTHTHQ